MNGEPFNVNCGFRFAGAAICLKKEDTVSQWNIS